MESPRVLLVGGPDVDARLDLMRCLADTFSVGALGSQPALSGRFAAAGFPYHAYPLSRRVDPIADLWSVATLGRIFRRLRPHVVHAFDTKPGIWACLAARLAGVPVVLGTVTGLGSLYGSNHLAVRTSRQVYQRLQTLACAAADLTIFQNHDDYQYMVAAGIANPAKARIVLGSGVETVRFAPERITDLERARLRTELGIQPAERVVTMISRVMRSKGIAEFVRAAQGVRSRAPNVRFLLVGPHDAESLDRLTASELAELRQQVIWPGSRRDVPVILAISDVFVLPSAYREGIPRVLLEAASMGLPIITTDTPGCREVIRSGSNGFLIPVGDAAALSRGLFTLLNQPELSRQFGEESRRRAVEIFDLSVIAAQTRSIYQELLERKSLLPMVSAARGRKVVF